MTTRTSQAPAGRRRVGILGLAALAVFLAAPVVAQAPTGRWEGAIEIPTGPLAIEVELTQSGDGWSGAISIPAQSLEDLALADVKVDGAAVSFRIPNIPGDPTFGGTWSEDGNEITGTFTQGMGSYPFHLARPGAGRDVSEALEGWDAWLEQAMADWGVPGMAVGIVKGGEVVLAKGYGLRDREAKLPVTEHTLFAIGSSTKAFTTYAMGRLVDAGELDWDTAVVTYMPDLRLDDDYATLHLKPRDMVTHRSGLPRHDLAWYNSTMRAAELVKRMPYFPFSRELRETFQYNNMMFVLSGELVSRLTGKPWEDAITEWVLEPLGMDETVFTVQALEAAPDHAAGYGERADTLWRMAYRDITNVGPAGSINSNVDDMVRWVRMHLGDGRFDGQRLIEAATLRELHTPQMVIGGLPEDAELAPASYAMGWFVDGYRGHLRVHHGGNIDGFSALVALFPHDDVGVVMLTNRNGTPLPGLAIRHLADRLFGLEPRDWNAEALARREAGRELEQESEQRTAAARVEGTRPSHELDAYVGVYGDPGYGTLEIRRQGRSNLLMVYNSIEAPLEHWHYDVFNGLENPADPTFEDMKIQFRTSVDGEVTQVVAPFEPAVAPIVFERQPDPELSDPSYLERFVGTYQLGPQTIRVALRGSILTASLQGQPTLELEPLWNDAFKLSGLEGYRVVFTTEDGRVTEAVFHQPNGVFPAERVEPEG